MLHLTDHLSVWELSHRWHDIDPNTSQPEAISLQVQDTIRFICRALVNCEISVCDEDGIEKKNPANLPSYDAFLARESELEDSSGADTEDEIDTNSETIDFDDSSWADLEALANKIDNQSPTSERPTFEDEYEHFSYLWSRRHWELVDGLDKTYKLRVFDRNELEKAHISQQNLLELCKAYEVSPPRFWFSQEIIDKSSHELIEEVTKGSLTQPEIDAFWESLKHKQKARIMSREIAKVLWRENPKLTIVDIENGEFLDRFGMASTYKGKHTIRNWIKDLKPNDKS